MDSRFFFVADLDRCAGNTLSPNAIAGGSFYRGSGAPQRKSPWTFVQGLFTCSLFPAVKTAKRAQSCRFTSDIAAIVSDIPITSNSILPKRPF